MPGLRLIDRLAALVPPPRVHRHRYYGVLAPNSPLRPAVIVMALSGAPPLRVRFRGFLRPLRVDGHVNNGSRLCKNASQFRIGGSCDPSASSKNRIQRNLSAQHSCMHDCAVFLHSLGRELSLNCAERDGSGHCLSGRMLGMTANRVRHVTVFA